MHKLVWYRAINLTMQGKRIEPSFLRKVEENLEKNPKKLYIFFKGYYFKNVISSRRTTGILWNLNAQTSRIQSNKREHVRKTDWTKFSFKKFFFFWRKVEKIRKNYILSFKDFTFKMGYQAIAALQISEIWMFRLILWRTIKFD